MTFKSQVTAQDWVDFARLALSPLFAGAQVHQQHRRAAPEQVPADQHQIPVGCIACPPIRAPPAQKSQHGIAVPASHLPGLPGWEAHGTPEGARQGCSRAAVPSLTGPPLPAFPEPRCAHNMRRAPVFLTLCHMLACAFMSWGLSAVGVFPVQPMKSRRQWGKVRVHHAPGRSRGPDPSPACHAMMPPRPGGPPPHMHAPASRLKAAQQ